MKIFIITGSPKSLASAKKWAEEVKERHSVVTCSALKELQMFMSVASGIGSCADLILVDPTPSKENGEWKSQDYPKMSPSQLIALYTIEISKEFGYPAGCPVIPVDCSKEDNWGNGVKEFEKR